MMASTLGNPNCSHVKFCDYCEGQFTEIMFNILDTINVMSYRNVDDLDFWKVESPPRDLVRVVHAELCPALNGY